jgi:hypothetical protein
VRHSGRARYLHQPKLRVRLRAKKRALQAPARSFGQPQPPAIDHAPEAAFFAPAAPGCKVRWTSPFQFGAVAAEFGAPSQFGAGAAATANLPDDPDEDEDKNE